MKHQCVIVMSFPEMNPNLNTWKEVKAEFNSQFSQT